MEFKFEKTTPATRLLPWPPMWPLLTTIGRKILGGGTRELDLVHERGRGIIHDVIYKRHVEDLCVGTPVTLSRSPLP